jgi:hypothetical protein
MSKRAGRKSQAANDFLEPKPVESLSATNVGSSRAFNNGRVDLSWSLPAGSPEATSYSITTTPSSTTETTSNTSFTFTGLSSNTSYTFSVTGSNAAGTSAPTTSSSVLVSTVPQAPSAPTASSPNVNQDSVSWSAPSNNGGSSITGYKLKSSDGPVYDYGSGTTTATISETGGTSQSYQVLATNANGDSEYSSSSSNVTTTAPFFPPFFPYFPPFFPFFPFFPPYFPPAFGPYFPPFFPFFPFFPPSFGPHFKAGKAGCIGEKTFVMTAFNGWVFAEEIKPGDKLLTIDPKDFGNGDVQSLNLSPRVNLIEINVVSVESSVKDAYSINSEDAYFSGSQPIFVKSDDIVKYINVSDLKIGDTIISIDEQCFITETIVESINKIENHKVYDIRTEPYQWFIAGGHIVIS